MNSVNNANKEENSLKSDLVFTQSGEWLAFFLFGFSWWTDRS